MINLNLRRIQTFLALAEHGSFRRVAERLNRSQSVVSSHIKQLEEEVGVPLVNRTTRQVSLTPEGLRLAARCKIALVELDTAIKELQDEVQLSKGIVSISCSPSVSTHFMPPIISEFQNNYPGISFYLNEDFPDIMYGRLRRMEADFAIGPKPEHQGDMVFEEILSDPIVAIVPKNLPIGDQTEVTLKELASYPYLAMPSGTIIRKMIEVAFYSQGLQMVPRLEVIHQQTIFSMVEAGLGVTIMPQLSVPKTRGDYRVLRLIEPTITRQVGLIFLRGRNMSPAAQCCIDLVQARLKSHLNS